jgi:dTDP-4-dehydrorhamnose reductase
VLDCSRFESTFCLAPRHWQEDLADVLAILRQQEHPAFSRERSSRA